MTENRQTATYILHTEDNNKNLHPREILRTVADRLMPMSGSYLEGKTRIRDALMDELPCSASVSEELVDAFEADGYLRYVGPRGRIERGHGYWCVSAHPRPERRRRRRFHASHL